MALSSAPGPAYTAEERDRAAETLAALPGGAELISWFGYPTEFHDAKILSIDLGDAIERAGSMCARVFFLP